MASGHADDVEACAEYLDACGSSAHWRTRSTPSERRWKPPPAAPGRALPDLGDAQRIASQGIEHAGGDLRGDSGRHRDRGQRRPCGHRHRAHVHPHPARRHPVGVPRSRARRPRRPGGASRAAPRNGRTRRWRWPSARSAATGSARRSTRPRLRDRRARVARKATAGRGRAPATSPPPTRAPCCAHGLFPWASTSSPRQTWWPTCRTSDSPTPACTAAQPAPTSGDCATRWPRPGRRRAR